MYLALVVFSAHYGREKRNLHTQTFVCIYYKVTKGHKTKVILCHYKSNFIEFNVKQLQSKFGPLLVIANEKSERDAERESQKI